MIYQNIIPAAIKELNFVTVCPKEFMPSSSLTKVEKLKSFIDDCSKLAGQVDDEMESLGKFETAKDKGMYILNTIVPLADALRAKADSMERYISKENQPYPTYEELFFAIDYDK